MKIIKIPITEQNREVYWSRNKDKKAWEKLMSECPSTSEVPKKRGKSSAI